MKLSEIKTFRFPGALNDAAAEEEAEELALLWLALELEDAAEELEDAGAFQKIIIRDSRYKRSL